MQKYFFKKIHRATICWSIVYSIIKSRIWSIDHLFFNDCTKEYKKNSINIYNGIRICTKKG